MFRVFEVGLYVRLGFRLGYRLVYFKLGLKFAAGQTLGGGANLLLKLLYVVGLFLVSSYKST